MKDNQVSEFFFNTYTGLFLFLLLVVILLTSMYVASLLWRGAYRLWKLCDW